ncbi:unnamed protein product [Pedinophyceae sp. YPF-701]|nr:unnamed protein product [Pedinophyceae sp. YPF-701]
MQAATALPRPASAAAAPPASPPAPARPLPRARRSVLVRAAPAEADPKRRVVVTGMGVVSVFGDEVDQFYDALLEGRSGLSQIERFDTSGMPTTIGGEIKNFDVGDLVGRKWARRVDTVIKYALVSGKKAMIEAGLLDRETLEVSRELDKQRAGILIGSAFGGFTSFADAVEAQNTRGFRKMNPFCIPFAIINMPGAMLAMDTGLMGPNYPINTACATGNYCILNAVDHIRRGDADVMIAGGAEAALMPSGLAGFIACKALSSRNEDPAGASRPWDKNRDGFVMGEGAGALVLESLEHAQKRGAPILAEVLGGSMTADAYHMTNPHPEGVGVKLCIEKSLEVCGVAPEEVTYVNAHATSTMAGDMAEYKALKASLHDLGSTAKINATKSMIGHLLGAAGAVEAVASVRAVQTGWVHPNLNLEEPEDGLDLSLLAGKEKEQVDMRVALSNSFGFGGHNSSVLFKKWEG